MQRSLLKFEEAIKSEETKKLYKNHLKSFLSFTKIKDPDGLLQLKDTFIQELLEDYLFSLKKRLNPNSIPQRFAALELFFAMNDKVLNFKKIKKMYPAAVKTTGRDYWTTEDIRKMLQVAKNKRTIALIHFLSSTGCRIGALFELRLKHVADIEDCKAITLYPGSIEEYTGFLTPEASRAFDDYINKRRNDGEIITSDTPLFRRTYAIGSAKARPVTASSLKKLMMDIEKKASLTRIRESKSRHNIQILHGFRKRFNNILKDNKEGNLSLKEKLMGHSIESVPLDETYHNPKVQLLFNEFKTHIPNLTIDPTERQKLELAKKDQTISELEGKNQRISNLEANMKIMFELITKSKPTVISTGKNGDYPIIIEWEPKEEVKE